MKNLYVRRTSAVVLSLSLLAALVNMTSVKVNAAPKNNVTINEICSKNTTYAAPDGGFYDWIELYNGTGSSVDLSGWGLSDKNTEPYKFTFSNGTVISPGQRMLVFCDSNAATTNNSYALFGLSTSGETLTLTNSSGNIIDTVTFEAMISDTSYGQYPDGSGDFYTLRCTPSQQNQAPEDSNAVKKPVFSAESGFYNNSFSLSIEAPSGTTVYYTLDGSNPTSASERYTGPITVKDMSSTQNVLSARTDISADKVAAPVENVDKAAIVRAIAVDSQGRTSEIITKTYFIGTTNTSYYKDMKVVSLVTDPSNLFDYEKGIYVKGKIYDENNSTPGNWGDIGAGFDGGFGDWGNIGDWGGAFGSWNVQANYTQKGREWEREASFELFENGKSVLIQDVGIRIKGAASRNTPQKSFNVFARSDYGKSDFDYDFFDGTALKAKNGKVIDSFDSITLRNGGNDNAYAMFRDSINQQLVSDRDFATQATSECVVFIDGEYWGLYQITEKVSDDFIKSHYGVNKDDVAIIKNSTVEEGTDQDLNDWNTLIKMCASSDMTDSAKYSEFCQKVDVQSFIDYFSAQIYWNNGDWPHNNLAAWRSNVIDSSNAYADGKWRMFLFDTEYSVGLYGDMNTSISSNCFTRMTQGFNSSDIGRAFAALLKNPQFREQFALTFMDMANYNFAPEKTNAVIEKFKSNYRQYILDGFERFYSDTLSDAKGEERFETEYKTISNYYLNRFNYASDSMKNALGLTGTLGTLTVNNNGQKGTISLNTLTLDDSLSSWSGKYYSDYKVTVSAEAKEGCTFSHWEVNGVQLSSSELYSPEVSFTVNGNVSITAVYNGNANQSSIKGDYNSDGQVNVADLVILQKYILGNQVSISKNEVVVDGATNIFDVIALRKLIIG